jgi:hypothetical protein
MRMRTVLLLAVVPALALDLSAAPKKKPAKKAPAEKAPTEKAPADPPADKPADAPADKPADAKATPPSPAPQTPPPGDTKPAKTEDKLDKPDKPAETDVDSLRQEYLSLRDELFKSRARASAVASQLYSTRIQIRLAYTSARYYSPAKATIRLDGASVYENASGAIGGDDGVRFDGYIAPGKHLITFRVEATGKDDDTFTSVTESQIVVKAVAGKDLVVAAKAKDSGDIAYEWKRKERGSYGLGIDVSVKTVARANGDAKGKK